MRLPTRYTSLFVLFFSLLTLTAARTCEVTGKYSIANNEVTWTLAYFGYNSRITHLKRSLKTDELLIKNKKLLLFEKSEFTVTPGLDPKEHDPEGARAWNIDFSTPWEHEWEIDYIKQIVQNELCESHIIYVERANSDCSICDGTKESLDWETAAACGHGFHRVCLAPAMLDAMRDPNKNKCPKCGKKPLLRTHPHKPDRVKEMGSGRVNAEGVPSSK